LSFPILNNYLAEKHRPCPRATVCILKTQFAVPVVQSNVTTQFIG
jgi:hypothetical protein